MDAASVGILITLLDRAAAWGAVIAQAQAEGRAISAAEIESFFEADNVADKRLQDAIARAKVEGR